jgi:hypothetical protein
LLPLEGSPHDSWALMASRMNEAAKQRNLNYRQFIYEIVKDRYYSQFPDRPLPRQKMLDFEEGIMRALLKNTSHGMDIFRVYQRDGSGTGSPGYKPRKFPLFHYYK